MKQKKKEKFAFRNLHRRRKNFFFYLWCDCEAKNKKKRPANHYSRRSRRSLSLTAAASGPGLKGLGWCEATDMCLIQGSCCRILLQDPVAGSCWTCRILLSRDRHRLAWYGTWYTTNALSCNGPSLSQPSNTLCVTYPRQPRHRLSRLGQAGCLVRAEMKIAFVRTFVFIGKGIFWTTAAPTHVSVRFCGCTSGQHQRHNV